MKNRLVILLLALLVAMGADAQTDTARNQTLKPVSIRQKKNVGLTRMAGASNGQVIGQGELFRAACCSLGESFVTNPSVDVNYNDAAVGARQIKLLGLSGQYVQMLVENLPVTLGAAMPYSLGYIPGAWMKSISVSKGASSVKNGPQSITGQINVEYVKPDDEPDLKLNFYTDSRLRAEANLMGNIHLNEKLSTELLVHAEKDFMQMDENEDGWYDAPAVEQLHLQNRWKYKNGRYIMHAGIGLLDEERNGGQRSDWSSTPFTIDIRARRMDAYMKHAFLLNASHNTNLAFTATGSLFTLDNAYGNSLYTDDQKSLSTQLLLEHEFNESHSLSSGLSLNCDRFDEALTVLSLTPLTEYTPGLFAQYTFEPSYHFTLMTGIRIDHSNYYDRTYATPRLHIKWVVTDWMTLRASAGKGYRTPVAIAENHYLLLSGRTLTVGNLRQEEAWNTGASAAFYIPISERTMTVNAEYYYTDFINQAVVDYDSDPTRITIDNLSGSSYSHTLQVDASYDLTSDLNLLAAWRYNKVMCTYGTRLLEKPLQSRYKGLLTLGWKPMMALWQIDITLQLNGGGRIPDHYENGALVTDQTFPAYPQLNLQLTRQFRHFSLYIGGENLTNYRQPVPVVDAANPWSATFDPTLLWGPVHGIMAYAGIRLNIFNTTQ